MAFDSPDADCFGDGTPWAKLIASARDGDSAARDELHRRFEHPLSSFLRTQVGKRLGRTVSISDLSQESFLHSFDAIARLPQNARRGDFEAMLFRNARWVIGTHARRNGRFGGESEGDGGGLGQVPDERSERSSGSVTTADEARWFSAQLDRLKPEQAVVLRLRMSGCTFEEISSELGISEHAARKRYLRAAIELRRLAESHRQD